MWFIIALGALSVLYAAVTLPAGIIDGYFLLLTLVTAVIGSHIAIRIPRINVNITVDDTFVFIALLLYGGGRLYHRRTGGRLLGAENQS